MRRQPRWFIAALLPLAVGILWLNLGWSAGPLAGLIATLPGAILTAAGGALLLWPGDRQISRYLALAAVVSLPLALFLWPTFGGAAALLLVAGGVAAFLVAGLAALFQNPVPRAVPMPVVSATLARKAATDEALLGWFMNSARIPRGRMVARDHVEIEAAETAARRHGWRAQPQTLHRPPPAPRHFDLQSARGGRLAFEWLTFDSAFRPHPALPGGARWHGHAANRTMRARVLRHPGAPRPWVVCVHGYRMGLDWLDLPLFDVAHLHHRLGLNLIMPTLPLHGARTSTRLTGGLYLDGPLVDLLHAQSQALWDLRRCIAWVRAQQGEDTPIGVLGYSLGGYNAALLAAFEPTLACVIAGIPLSDIPAALWHHMPGLHLRFIEAQGITQARLSELLEPVSPLALTAAVPRQRRYLFAASADQLVPPAQPLRLWTHWDRPTMHWYHGSHLSVRHERSLRPFVTRALRESGLAADA